MSCSRGKKQGGKQLKVQGKYLSARAIWIFSPSQQSEGCRRCHIIQVEVTQESEFLRTVEENVDPKISFDVLESQYPPFRT